LTHREFEAMVGVTAGLWLWVLFSSLLEAGDPFPVLGAVGLLAVAFVIALAIPARAATLVAGGIVLLVVGLVVVFLPSLQRATSPPLGYANANAALVTQCAAAAALLALRSRGRVSPLGRAVVVAAGLLVLYIGSIGAFVGWLFVVGGLAFGAGGDRARRAWVSGCLAAVLASSALAFVVGAAGSAGAATDLLSQRRVSLWTEGWSAVLDRPVTGVGAGDFAEASTTARNDPDATQAHAELLQRAVENGVPGAGLELVAILLPLAVLLRRPHRTAPVAAASWAALWIQAGVDYVPAFPAVLLTAAVVTGIARPEAAMDAHPVKTAPRPPD
jgi:O-antigen ligase